MEDVFRPGRFGQVASGGDVIGMKMRINDVENTHARFFGRAEIGSNVAEGIDDRGGSLSAASEQVGRSHGIGVEKLAQNHSHTSEFDLGGHARRPAQT